MSADTRSPASSTTTSGYELDGGDALSSSLAEHGDAPWQQIVQPIGGSVGAVLLQECEQTVENDDDEDGEPELRHAGENRQTAGDPEHHRKEVNELRQQTPPPRDGSHAWQHVRAGNPPAQFDFGEREAVRHPITPTRQRPRR
jgi:hypothetical protein